ncbi:hypothetical protein ASPCAL10087 [Aspergillus calidoustus]|uniref:Tail specific protease domain-containing protein n=1 Tax=Aspergillus calidoustus TaxID=454130 RepID=A0A0U5G6U5_ASPCI|nr:hypothetical protein ASPCAL10087 [Aspergillus calidoustus]
MTSQTQTPEVEFRNWLHTADHTPEHPASLDDETRRGLIENIINAIQNYYLNQDAAAQLATTLRARVSEGIYNHISSSTDLARTVTTDLQALSGDKHFRCIFGISPEEPSREEQRATLEKMNYGFGDVRTLDGSIALVDMTLFPPVHWEGVRDKIQNVLRSLSCAATLIIDLRKCRGGDPRTVALISSYLDKSEGGPWLKMVRPSDGMTEELRGEPLPKDAVFSPEKPIYVLTSHATISGGEDLAYGLQARKRATVIGERTAGAANLPRACVLPGGFVLWVPHKYPVCPVTDGNWEGVGIAPDIVCEAETGVDRAVALAVEGLNSRKGSTMEE